MSWTATWGIALNTIRRTTRRLAALVTLVFVVLCGLFVLFFLEGDNTLIGQLRVVLTWSFGFMSVILMALVVYFSSTVLDSEMVGRQIYILDVKPVPRWQILAGKWLGLVIVCGVLLALMGIGTYGILRWLARPLAEPSAARAAESPRRAREEGGLERVEERFFVSRRSWRPHLKHADRLVEDMARDLLSRGRVDARTTHPTELGKALRARLEERLPPISFGDTLEFAFTGLPADVRAELSVRYKLYGRRGKEPELLLRHRWELTPGGAPEPLVRTLTSRAGSADEFRAAAAIGPDGTLGLSLTNLTGDSGDVPPTQLLVPNRGGIELLLEAGSFEMNLARGLLLLWIRLIMLAGIGIAANTFLRGSVTAFLLFGLILTGSLSSFVSSLVAPPRQAVVDIDGLASRADQHAAEEHAGHDHPHGSGDGEGVLERLVDTWTQKVLPVLFGIVPDFKETDPVPDLLIGRELGWGRVARQALYDIGLRTGAFWLLGLYCFYRKEVGLPVAD